MQVQDSVLLVLWGGNPVGASSMADMGKVMKVLIPRLEGRASGQEASQMVRNLLQ